MSRSNYRQKNNYVEGWEEGIPDYGPPAANPARLGKPAIDLERMRAEYAEQMAIRVAKDPELRVDVVAVENGRKRHQRQGEVK